MGAARLPRPRSSPVVGTFPIKIAHYRVIFRYHDLSHIKSYTSNSLDFLVVRSKGVLAREGYPS
jgi:hypothetical protein